MDDLHKEQKESEEISKEESKEETSEILDEAKKDVKIEDSSGEHTLSEEPKKIEEVKVPDKKKEGSFKPIIFVMIASIALAMFWDQVPFIKDSVNAVLNPTAGWLLNFNLTWGMMIIVFIISLFTTLVQKYATDQKAIKELRKEQKILQDEMKKYKEHPEKMAELSKKQFAFIPKTFKLTSRSIMFTGIPFILFFKWFNDFFVGKEIAFFGLSFFSSWFWFYLIFVMIFSTILRKALKVV